MIQSRLISLAVTADNPFAEIFVVDGDYTLVARGIAYVEAQVVPGIFKIKTRLGRFEVEDIRVVETDAAIRVSAPGQISPIPVSGTRMTDAWQSAAAQEQSKIVHVNRGSGAQIFLMSRRWSAEPAAMTTAGGNPAAGVQLLDAGGDVVADYGIAAAVGRTPRNDTWAGCTVSVDPGAYLLRTSLREGAVVDQVVFAPAGWQLQLFLLDSSSLDAERHGTIDLSTLANMAMSMAKLGEGFSGTDTLVAQADLVRIALADGRPVFSNAVRSLLDDMLRRKFDNPIFGLYGAHLMLMGRAYVRRAHDKVGRSLEPQSFQWVFDEALYDLVITNLRLLLGSEHADVEALSLKCKNPALQTTRPATVPPMLRSSWSLLVEASNAAPELLPVGLWQRIAAMVPTGPFLAWRSGSVGSALQAIEAAFPYEIRNSLGSDADRSRLSMELDVPRAAIDSVFRPELA